MRSYKQLSGTTEDFCKGKEITKTNMAKSFYRPKRVTEHNFSVFRSWYSSKEVVAIPKRWEGSHRTHKSNPRLLLLVSILFRLGTSLWDTPITPYLYWSRAIVEVPGSVLLSAPRFDNSRNYRGLDRRGLGAALAMIRGSGVVREHILGMYRRSLSLFLMV